MRKMAVKNIYVGFACVGILMWIVIVILKPIPQKAVRSSSAKTCENGYFQYTERQIEV